MTNLGDLIRPQTVYRETSPAILKILLVDDDRDDYIIINALLASIETVKYQLDWVDNIRAALTVIERTAYDVCLVDYFLGQYTGLDLIRQAFEMGVSSPMILLTGKHHSDIDYQAMRSGAADFIIKDELSAPLLERSIRYAIERARHLAALRDSNRTLQLLIQASPLAITFLDNESNVRIWNPAAERIFGWKQEEVLGRPLPINPPQEEHCIGIESGSFISENTRFLKRMDSSMETVRYRKDGSPVPVSISVAGLVDENHSLKGMMAIMADITERKRAEQALKESEERLRIIMEGAPVMIWMFGAGKLSNYFNKSWHEFIGWDEHQDIGVSWIENIHPKDLQRYLDTCVEAFEAHRDFSIEYRLKRGDGDYRWILDTGRPRFNEDGSFAGYIGTCIDITARKQAEERISEQAELLDKAQDAIIVQNLEDRILYWNNSAERLYGWSSTEALETNAIELLFNNSSTYIKEPKQLTIEKGEWTGELPQVTRDGKEIVVESRWTLLRDNAGAAKGILIVNTDITEKKRLGAQFLRAQRMESIGTLAGGIAHDLNNILSPIMMAVQLLKRKCADEQSQQILATLEGNAQRGADMVKQVLSFARGMEGERMPLQLKHLIVDLEKMLNQTLPRSIRINVSVDKDIKMVLGDATQLYQVLVNLSVNARDSMPHGGKLTVSVENAIIDENYTRMNMEARPGSYVRITVSDVGAGIPPDIIDKIFEPFFTTKEPGKGTGLGLSTALTIVRSHGGFIDVESELGKGTTFNVYLPTVEAEQEDRPEQNDNDLPMGNGELILVIDDEAPILNITRATLEAYGYEVLAATDGAEAVALYAANKERVKAVITDMMMPYMDGAATIRALQRLNAGVSIIATSGLMSSRAAEWPDNSVKAFLPKPYTAERLLTVLHSILSE